MTMAIKGILLELAYRTGTIEYPGFAWGVDLTNLCRRGFRAEVRPRAPGWMSNEDLLRFMDRCSTGCEICLFKESNGCFCDGMSLRFGYATPEIFKDNVTVAKALKVAPCGKYGVYSRLAIRLF